MEELVFKSEKGTPITTSLLVAQKFGKRHDHVLRDIENLSCSESFRLHNFGETPYVHPQNGQTYRMYVMTKDGFTFLVMGYTGEQAGKFKEEYISAFNKMEEIIKDGGFYIPKTYGEALGLAAKQAEQIEKQQHLLTLQAPKVAFADAVATSDRSVLVAELAKILKQNGVDMGQNRLFVWLRKNGYLCSKGEYHNQPTQKAMDLGLFEIKKTIIAKPDGSTLSISTTKVTGKGIIYFINKFLSNEHGQTNAVIMQLT
jgi:anti-repressor protein